MIANDLVYSIPVITDARAMRDVGGKVFLYSFDHQRTPGVGFTHAEDLNYVMGFAKGTDGYGSGFLGPLTPQDLKIQKASLYLSLCRLSTLQIYLDLYANFIKYGDPTPNTHDWNPLARDMDNCYSIKLPPEEIAHFREHAVNFWTVDAPALVQGATLQAQMEGLSTRIYEILPLNL